MFEVRLFGLTGRFQDSLLFTLFHLLVAFLHDAFFREVETVDASRNTNCPGNAVNVRLCAVKVRLGLGVITNQHQFLQI